MRINLSWLPDSFNPAFGERREKGRSVPDNLFEFLSEDQCRTLLQVESFGWRLAFVRRPALEAPVVVICHCGDTAYSVVEGDGTLNDSPHIVLRA